MDKVNVFKKFWELVASPHELRVSLTEKAPSHLADKAPFN